MTPVFVCHACGSRVDVTRVLPFRCPKAGQPGDDRDHLLVPEASGADFTGLAGEDPFLRYRHHLSGYRLARAAGLADDVWSDILGHLDDALTRVEGHGFRLTPMREETALAEAAGIEGPLWVKDETGAVGGSHKARHLMGVMLYLRVLQAAGLPAADGLSQRRLAIASCGNAALAAAVIARAADWPLDVFIPPDASQAVVDRLRDLGAAITVCHRQDSEVGDPCYLAFQRAVAAGALAFGVQGCDNGLAIEGGHTLAFEMAETFARAGVCPDYLYVQVGGGALASALGQGFAIAAQTGLLPRKPRLITVQTDGCAPLARAWTRLGSRSLEAAAEARSQFMWPWETTPHSLAHGILDDETYDWWEIVRAMQQSGGRPLVVSEDAVEAAWKLGRERTGISVSATGTAGLAGILAGNDASPAVRAVIFSGLDR